MRRTLESGNSKEPSSRLVSILLPMALVLGACALSPATTTTALSDDEAAYADCMRDAGFDLAEIEPIVSGEDIQPGSVRASQEFQQVDRRCIVSSGIGDVVGDSPEEIAEKDTQALTMTQCMRDRGWEMPDPVRDAIRGYLIPGSPVVPIDADQQAVQLADLQECGEEAGISVFESDD